MEVSMSIEGVRRSSGPEGNNPADLEKQNLQNQVGKTLTNTWTLGGVRKRVNLRPSSSSAENTEGPPTPPPTPITSRQWVRSPATQSNIPRPGGRPQLANARGSSVGQPQPANKVPLKEFPKTTQNKGLLKDLLNYIKNPGQRGAPADQRRDVDVSESLKKILDTVRSDYSCSASKHYSNPGNYNYLADGLKQLGELCIGTEHEEAFKKIKAEVDKRDQLYGQMDQGKIEDTLNALDKVLTQTIKNNGGTRKPWNEEITIKRNNFRNDEAFDSAREKLVNDKYSSMERAVKVHTGEISSEQQTLEVKIKFNKSFEEAFNDPNGETKRGLLDLKLANPTMYEQLKGRFQFTDEQVLGRGAPYVAPELK